VYGPGTAAAVAALYTANGVAPALSGSRATLAQLRHDVRAAAQTLSAAQAKLAADESSHASKSVLAADRAAVAAAQRHLAAAQRALAKARRTTGAGIPMGEVVFIPRMPAHVLSVAKLGSTIGSGKTSGSSGSAVQIGSGKVSLKGFANPVQARLLRPGMTGTARSDVSGTHFSVRITAVSGPRVALVPVGPLPGRVVGQNVQVTVTASRVRSLIVPVAAVSTAGDGQPFLTLSVGGGRTRAVTVRLGVSSGGLQAVTPVRPNSLRAGDLVVLGIGSAK
jgi:hypothetical protein